VGLGGGGLRLLACGLCAVSCRDPTQLTLEIRTNADCLDHQGTSITVGKLGAIETKSPAAQTLDCESPTGRIGSLVVVPSSDKDEPIAVRVVTGIVKTPEQCVESSYQGGCIVARRALRFIPHESLFLPILMNVDCRDIACEETETCVNGQCVSAAIDPTECRTPSGCALEGKAGSAGAGGMGGGAGAGGSGGIGGSAGASGSGGTSGSGGSSGASGSGAAAGGGGTAGVTCTPPLADCDQNAQNGCEVDLGSDGQNCGSCGVSCLGGACNAARCEPISIAASPKDSTGIAVDGQNVYWTDQDTGLVLQAPLSAGATPITLATGQALATGVAVDASHVYWTSYTNAGRVARVPIGGGTSEIIAEPEPFPPYVAVDGDHAYWTNMSNQGTVKRAPKNGAGNVQTLVTGQSFAWAVAVDSTHVYWTTWAANGIVGKAPKDGSGSFASVTPGEKTPYGMTLFGGTLFFTLNNAQGQLRSVSASATGAPSTLLLDKLSKPRSVAADASGLWITTQSTVYHLPPGATVPEEIASSVVGLTDVAVGPSAVCWATQAGPVCKGK
jgi:hypothetical protein